MHITNNKLDVQKQHAQDSIQSDMQAPSIDIGVIKKLIQEEHDTINRAVQEEIQRQIQDDKISLITIFGIFASITSFLTIEFQFLKTVNSLEKILGFSLILFVLLLSFNIALDYIVKSGVSKKTLTPSPLFYIIIGILFIVGVIFASRGNEELCKENFIYQRYAQEFESRLDYFHKDYAQKLNTLENSLKKLTPATV